MRTRKKEKNRQKYKTDRVCVIAVQSNHGFVGLYRCKRKSIYNYKLKAFICEIQISKSQLKSYELIFKTKTNYQ